MFRVRAGDQPGLDIAMRMATDLGTSVEVLFERIPAAAAA